MNKHPVVLIAFEESENLGIGYLSSVLSEAGINTVIIDFCHDNRKILKMLLKLNPLLVGFSVIFQFYINAFFKNETKILFASIFSFMRSPF